MGDAKKLEVKIIPSGIANTFIKKHHYSGKVVNNSKLHMGVFYQNTLHGVMSFGSSIDTRRMLNLVDGTKWGECIELNRMAFDDVLPRNSESRAIAIAMRLIKKNAPHIKWVVSFADGTQCGDGTIYRASGFILTQINPNTGMVRMPDGTITHRKSLDNVNKKQWNEGGFSYWLEHGATPLTGYMLRYIYFIDKTCRQKLTCPEIPYSKIGEIGATMYLGHKHDHA